MFRFLGFLLFLAAFSVMTLAQDSKPAGNPPQRTSGPAGTSGHPTVVLETTAGTMHCELFPDKAPIGVDNFIGLAKGTKDWTAPSGAKKHGVPLYDGTIFHRVIPNFMIQGGDPKGDGSGDPGYKFKNEVSGDLLFDRPGRLAYANSGPDTNGSQFFITEVATPHLNGGYTIFGQCDAATVELVKEIARMARDPRDDRPFRPVKITKVLILKPGSTAATHAPAHTMAKPAAGTPNPAPQN